MVNFKVTAHHLFGNLANKSELSFSCSQFSHKEKTSFFYLAVSRVY